MFYQVVSMMEILESNSFAKLNKTTWSILNK